MDFLKGDTLFLLIDFQEKLANVMDCDEIVKVRKNAEIFLKAANITSLPVIYTQQYTKGLGQTVEELRVLLKGEPIEKTAFSCYREKKFVNALNKSCRRHIVISGMEAHICVLQTALDLIYNSFLVTIISDAVISRNLKNRERALNFLSLKGANILPLESLLFILVGDAKDASFKDISKLIK
ncbi:MAG: isochorismatase family protein [Deferribacterota bacterium]|nr:isochorismatase family protein [Deferribacterota bacterium]